MKRLIINADDFGLTDGVCAGIVDAILHGVVTSTTAMVAVPGAATHLAHWAQAIPKRIGLHLQLTGGRVCRALDEVPSLHCGDGQFPRSRKQLNPVEIGEVTLEWQAQLARLREWGIEPTHLDSHHHVHHLRPVIPAFVGLAKAEGLSARSGPLPVAHALRMSNVPHPGYLDTSWYGDGLTADLLIQSVSQAFDRIGGQGTVELMCHPGYADCNLAAVSNYVEAREHELAVLCSSELAERLERFGVHLISYSELDREPLSQGPKAQNCKT